MASSMPLAQALVLVELGYVTLPEVVLNDWVAVAVVTNGKDGSALTPVLRSMRPSKSLQANSTVKSM